MIDEVPAKRKPIKNCVVDISYRKTAYRFMEKEIRQGHQVYVICPLVENSEAVESENVLDYTDACGRFSRQISVWPVCMEKSKPGGEEPDHGGFSGK